MSLNRATNSSHLLDSKKRKTNYRSMDDGIDYDIDYDIDDDTVAIDAYLSADPAIMPNHKIRSAVAGARLVADVVLPLAFWGLLLRDINEFRAHPENRYGNTILKILSGLSSNTQTYTSLFNINLMQSPLWQPALALPLAMILMGGANYLLQKNLHYVDDNESLSYGVLYDLFAPLWPRSEFSRYLREMNEAFLQNENILDEDDEAEQLALMHFIGDYKRRTGLAKFYSSKVIANFFSTSAQSREERISELKNIGIHKDLSRFQVWKAGLSDRKLDNIFYLRHFFRHYPQILMIITGIKGAVEMIKDLAVKSQCQSRGGLYRYSNQFDLNTCVTCDWDILPDANSQEACVNSAIQYAESPYQTYTRLQTLHPGQEISVLDFSNQDMSQWSDAEFSQVFTELERIITTPLNRLDFSRSSQNIGSLSPGMMQRLGDFLQRMPGVTLDLSNQALGDTVTLEMLDRLDSAFINRLELFGNNLGDVFFQAVTEKIIAGKLTLNQLGFGYNQLVDANLAELSSFTNQPNSTLTQIDLLGNPISSNRLTEFLSEIKASSTLSILDISHINLDYEVVEALSQSVSIAPSLKDLRLENTGLSADVVPVLNRLMSKVVRLDVGNNDLADADIHLLFSHAASGVLEDINISNNPIDRMAVALQYLPDTVLKLNMSSNVVEESDFRAVISYLSHSNVVDISLASIPTNSAILKEFADRFCNRSVPLLSLDISDAGVTSKGAEFIFSIPSLHRINLARNLLNDIATPWLTPALINHHNLTDLDVSFNKFNSTSINSLSHAFPNQLKLFKMDGIGSEESAISLFKSIVRPTPHIAELSYPEISRDEARALYYDFPSTGLQELSLRNFNNTPAMQRAYLRTKPATNLQTHGIFLPNADRQRQLSIPTSATYLVLASGYGIAIGLFLILLLAHKIYTCISDEKMKNKQRRNR